jgi:tight adherence protein B
MLMIVLSIFLCIFAVAVLALTLGNGTSKRLSLKVAAWGKKLAAPAPEELPADIRRRQNRLSGIPWLNSWLARLNLASKCHSFLHQADVTQSMGNLLLMSVAAYAVVALVLSFQFGAVIPALLFATGALPLPFGYVQRKRAKRLLKLEKQLPDALGMMAGALRVGHSLAASLGAVATESQEPISGEMRKCFEEQNFGVDFRTSLVNLTERVPLQDFRIFTAAVLIQRESGGNLAEVLERLAQTTRERFRLKKQISIHTAQGRMTGWILSLFPIALGFGMYLVNPGSMSVLWTTSTGLTILYVAAGMDVVGALIIRKIVKIQV